MMLNSNCDSASFLSDSSQDINSTFWKLWQQYRDYLYRCCLKWMGGNPTDAEDALSRAMLKAWEKVQHFAGAIANFKAWLTRLTYNVCLDIHRECNRRARRVKSLETTISGEDEQLVSPYDTPVRVIMRRELQLTIRQAIDKLPTRLRDPFTLHFYQDLAYQDIARQLNISYDNVRKRISEARSRLRKQLNGYLTEVNDPSVDLSVLPFDPPKSRKRAKSAKYALKEPVISGILVSAAS